MTSKSLTLAVTLSLASLAGAAFPGNNLAAQAWKEKPAESWTQDDLVELLNDSPWARKINLWQMTGRRMAVFPDGSKAVYQASPNSPVISYSVEPDHIEPERVMAVYVVRWSSAPLVAESLGRLHELSSVLAEMQALPPELSPGHFVLTVRVAQPPTESASDRFSRATILSESGRPLPDQEAQASDVFAGLTEAELLAAAELRSNRKLRLKPDRAVRRGLGAAEGISFFFPREQEGQAVLPPSTKWAELRFKDKLGNELKARFNLREILSGGPRDQ